MSLVPTREEVPQFAKYSGIPGPKPPAAAAGGGFSAKDLLRILRRRKWLILICIVLFSGAGVLTTFLWLKFRPTYQAFAYLEVNPPRHTVLGTRGNEFLPGEMMARHMTSIAQAISHEKVLREAIPKIRNTQWFAETQQNATNVVDELMEGVNIDVMPKSNFIMVSMEGQKPQDITQIVNAVADAAVEDTRELDQTDKQGEIEQLRDERRDLLKLQKDSLDTIKEIKSRGMGEALESERTLQLRQMQLERLYSEQQEMYIAALRGMKNIEGMTNEEMAELPEIQSYVNMDPKIQTLEMQVLNLSIEIERSSEEGPINENHRMIKGLKRRLDVVKRKLEEQRQKVTRNAIEQMKQLRQSQYLASEAQFEEISRKRQENDKKLKVMEIQKTTLEQSQETKRQAEERIKSLDNRLMDLRLLMRGEQQVTLRRMAVLPQKPSKPKYIIMVPLGVFLGMIIGVGLAFLLEFMDTSIRAPSDVNRRIELPMLGMIPHLDDVEEDIDDIRLVTASKVDTLIDEAFRQVRTNLAFSSSTRPHQSLLVTSPMPEDGRTTVAMNLAHAMVSAGQKVLVVDANFRQPMLRKLYPDSPQGGLSTVLSGQENWADAVHDITPGLSLLTSGPIPPNPTELLSSESMRRLIQELASHYDRILFDSAPCLVVSDALALSTMVDGSLLVVRAGVNSHGVVQRSRDTLLRLGSHIFGVVLNGVKVTAGGYLRKNYETFYEYREAPQLPSTVTAQDD
jgi:polysaccharide biosynthesis transport protein